MNSTGLTRCNTPVAVGTKNTHVMDVRHKCSSEIHSMNKLTTDQKLETRRRVVIKHLLNPTEILFSDASLFDTMPRVPCPQCFRGFSTVCHLDYHAQTIDLVHEVQSNFNP